MSSPLAAAVSALVDRLARRQPLPLWYHEAYRLPLDQLLTSLGIDPRRADLAYWGIRDALPARLVEAHTPAPASWAQLAIVHTPRHLESLTRSRPLSHMFGLDTSDFPVDEVLATVRLAAGGTLAAARTALERGGPTLNLLGGFHHAAPDRGAGFCPINDMAVALAVVRSEGFDGRAVVLDLDAHPPDGTAECLRTDPRAWIGSLSGSDWGPLPGVDETVLPPDTDDDAYLAALDALLRRAPRPGLAFVIAGGDVLAEDRMGQLGMSLAGVRRRDARVHEWLDGAPAVWLPGGGYNKEAWRLLARTATVLAGRGDKAVMQLDDPMAAHFARVARTLSRADLVIDDGDFTADEIDSLLKGAPLPPRLLDYYTAQGIEHALYAYGVLTHLTRLGYRTPRVVVDRLSTGDRFRLLADSDGQEVLLVEAVLRREPLGERTVLYIEWFTLRHPRGSFLPDRPRLPGQDVPGLGLAWEAGELFLRMAYRLDLDGIAYRPAWLHTAWVSRDRASFADPEVHGAFEALLRDLGHLGVARLSQAVHGGLVLQDGAPWQWQPEPLVTWLPDDYDAEHASRRAPRDPLAGQTEAWRARMAAARDRHHFTLVGAPAPGP